MDTSARPPALATRHGSVRWRPAATGWLPSRWRPNSPSAAPGTSRASPTSATSRPTWAIPPYFLVILGSWKVLGAVALLVPGRGLLKEWAYAGAFFVYTGAMASHLTTGYDVGEVAVLAVMTALTVLSWALRPSSRRTR